MTHIDTVDTSLGNTNTNDLKSRGWCFTLNNYTDTETHQIIEYCKSKKYIIGKEVGENGTPHLQGYIYSKNAIRFSTLKKICSRWHLEKAKGSMEDNRKYCSKEGNFETNIPAPKMKRRDRILLNYENTEWKNWQKDIIDIVNSPIDDRTINWFWEETGKVGKSYLNKYLVLKYDAIICSGKKGDVFNQVLEWFKGKDEDEDPRLVVVDCPREDMNYFNYGALESLKNGLIYSGKYEGGVCVFEPPHVICLANTPPDEHTMSKDRWNIQYIGSKKPTSDDEIINV